VRQSDLDTVLRRKEIRPAGLQPLTGWFTTLICCFQLMKCDDVQLFQQWIACLNDLVDFEIVAVQSSKMQPPCTKTRQDSRGNRAAAQLGVISVSSSISQSKQFSARRTPIAVASAQHTFQSGTGLIQMRNT
jgi:hypothetical protein